MTTWLIVIQQVHDTAWIEGYMANVPQMISKAGGVYIGSSEKITVIENDLTAGGAESATNVVVFRFPSRKHIEDFMKSDEYKPYSVSRKQGSKADAYILDDVKTEF